MAISPQDAEIIAQASGRQLGPEAGPAAPAGPMPAPPPGAVPPPAAPQEAPTPQEAVNANASPVSEGDQQQEGAVTMLEVDFGEGNKRKLSPAQIKGTFDRYGALNHKQMQMKPVIDFAEGIMGRLKEQGHDPKADDVAKFLNAAAQAFVKNPQQKRPNEFAETSRGRVDIPIDIQEGARQQAATDDFVDSLTKWEDDNGVSLPPGYKDQMSNMGKVMGQNEQLMKMVQQLSAGQGQVGELAAQQMQAAQSNQLNSMRETAANNLNRAQSKHKLPDDMEEAFMEFAFQRGYTFEDFIDPALTDAVVGDFSAVSQGPELDRLKSMAQRRTAYTGSVEGSPSAGMAAQTSASPDQDFFEGQVARALDKKAALNM